MIKHHHVWCCCGFLSQVYVFKLLVSLPPPSPCAWYFTSVMCMQCLSVSSVMAPKHIIVQQCDPLFDRWHVLTSKLADIGRRLCLDSHRHKLAICCNMPHRLRQGASVFKGIQWQYGAFIKGLSVCLSHIIFTLFQELLRAASDEQLFRHNEKLCPRIFCS